MTQSLIVDLLIILTAGLIAGLVCRWFRASVLIGYLVVGAILGQGVLGWIQDEDHQLEHFAEAGVFLLLFSIGLEFSLDDLKRLGRNLVVGGAVQMLLVAAPVTAILLALDMPTQSAVLIAAAVAFSSTVLVFKALSQWGQTGKPHGRRAVGILLFQDAALVPLLLMVPLLTGAGESAQLADYLILAGTSICFVAAVITLRWALARWVIPFLTSYRSPELVILFTIVSLGGFTLVAYRAGLPPAVGAFAAGLIFNGNRWTHQIDALVLPFRETFAAVFFVGLGLIFDPRLFISQPLIMFGSITGVIVLKTIAATVALRLTALSWRRSFGMGIGLAHVGEFAFVLVLLGQESGVLTELDYQRVVAIAVGSLILTPPLMKAGLRLIQDDEASEEEHHDQESGDGENEKATVIGVGPIGRRVASQLEIFGMDVCLVDLSPINLHPFAQEGFRTVTGDASDPAILKLAEVNQCRITVVCVPDDDMAKQVVKSVRKANRDGKLIVRCRYHGSAAPIRRLGASIVVAEETEAALALLKSLDQFSYTPSEE